MDGATDVTLEQELSDLEARLETAARAAKSALTELKKARASAKVGQLRDLNRSLGEARNSAKRFAEEGRADDNPESFKVRLAAYNAQTAPLLPHYLAQGKLVELDGMGAVESVARAIDSALEDVKV